MNIIQNRSIRVNDMKNSEEPEKLSFIRLLLLTCGGLVVSAALLWWVPYVGFSNIHPMLPLIMAIVFTAVVLYMIGGGLTLVFTILWGRNLFFNRRIRGVVIRFLFPLLVIAGKCVGIGEDRVRRSFIAIK